ncbi:MAG: cohesin domain-containing protein, partial [Oscillospiraceae bacterium]|nr:cohesin domain-containing protein [Oscillospiraceae bacterium]
TCSICGNSYVEIDEGTALEHDWDDGVVTTPPTYTTPGVMTYTCNRCGETRTEEIPILAFIYGDVTGQGYVDSTSALALAQYLAGFPGVEINLSAADLNGDGAVTATDLTILQRHVAGWPDYQILPLGGIAAAMTGFVFAQRGIAVESHAAVPGDPTINVADASGKVGEIVEVPISIENNPGVAAMLLNVTYDETMLKLVGYEDKGLLNSEAHRPTFASPYTLFWLDISGKSDNGETVTLFFEVLAEGTSEVSVSYHAKDILNMAFEQLPFGVSNGDVTGETSQENVIVNATTNAEGFISIIETAKNSKVWVLTFNVTEAYSDGSTAVVTYSVNLNGNNANLSGGYTFTDGALEGYTLAYDIAGNGSNIKDFRLIK